ncbi:MAG: hypothetical protein WD065_12610 [Planctomycetaceae bacterium]
MTLKIDTTIGDRKDDVLEHLRSRSIELLGEINHTFGSTQFKKRAAAVNKSLTSERNKLEAVLNQVASKDHWSAEDQTKAKLLLMHCTNVVMLETRNEVWPYEFMAFSRRIGELWEPFVTTCFDKPVRNDVSLFVPPLFKEIRKRLATEVREFIQNLSISEEDKNTLLTYYDQAWQLVTSGEIKLELDLHFIADGIRHVIDCKSGFGSNEKGNTNRLLLVASIYRNIEKDEYRCMMFVRSKEDENNHYLQTLKRSGLWEVFCGSETYPKVLEYSGFDLGQWTSTNIDWDHDLSPDFYNYLKSANLDRYLTW